MTIKGHLTALLIALLLPASGWARESGIIQLAPGFGRPDSFFLRGRVIEDKGRKSPRKRASRIRVLWETFKALESDEIEGVVLQITVGPHTFTTKTDDDGVFTLEPTGLKPPLPPGQHRVRVRTINDQKHPTPPQIGLIHILGDKSLAIISDFDDTIIQSKVPDTVQLLKNAASRNAAQIPLIPGAAAAYQAAIAGPYGTVFYLSGSPQNFLPRLMDVIRLNALPKGPVLLKNFGQDPTFDQRTYKLAHLRRVLTTCSKTRFLLVGDSGEHDPEVYAQLRGLFPDRIIGIVIRLVPGGTQRVERFTGMTTTPDYSQRPSIFLKELRPSSAP